MSARRYYRSADPARTAGANRHHSDPFGSRHPGADSLRAGQDSARLTRRSRCSAVQGWRGAAAPTKIFCKLSGSPRAGLLTAERSATEFQSRHFSARHPQPLIFASLVGTVTSVRLLRHPQNLARPCAWRKNYAVNPWRLATTTASACSMLFLIKENHIAACGGMPKPSVRHVKAPGKSVEGRGGKPWKRCEALRPERGHSHAG